MRELIIQRYLKRMHHLRRGKRRDEMNYNSDKILNVRQGKVRDVLETKDHILLVATDRISAFDVVMPEEIPGKGELLTKLSHWWFEYFEQIPNHLTEIDIDEFNDIFTPDAVYAIGKDLPQKYAMDRTTVCKKAKVIPIEFVVRGYITGSLWKDYDRCPRQLLGIDMPLRMKHCEEFPQPIFTPATKAPAGQHDENISFEKSVEICQEFLGWTTDAARQLMKELRERSINIYKEARTHAITRGIIIADTKFEYGIIEEDGRKQVVLIDELLTPDSSRFWSLEDYETGREQDSYDKQILRNYLQTLVDNDKWDKKAPGPSLPSELKEKILARYKDIVDRLMK